ncbi:MAG: efflux transporter outer membrane subunit [Sphingomonadales bacterium]|nr:efflux transporter outer membrane subunit [Sphingomonadales bacterium]
MTARLHLHAAVLAMAAALSGCNFAPRYHVPSTAPPAPAFKNAPGWVTASPEDAVAKGEWWHLFGDPALDALEARVVVTNQNVIAARAAFDQARALVQQDRAALFPTISAGAGVTHSKSFGGHSSTFSTNGALNASGTNYGASVSGSWAPDLWSTVTNTVRQANADAQASIGQLANATLSAQGELASDYLQLRGLDEERQVLEDSVAADTRDLEVTRNQYRAGTVSLSNVDTAQSALSSDTASLRDLARQRAAFEDAIAVLVGADPSRFAIAPARWRPSVPEVPGAIPAQVVQRRPDVAAAERQVAAANANIGVQKAAFFPGITLSGSASTDSPTLGNLFSAASSIWSTGAQVAETLLDFGARSARVAEARAAFNSAVADYRETVLTALQQVEDNLAATRVYASEADDLDTAASAADHALAIALNDYKAGTVDYTTVATAQSTANAAHLKVVQLVINRQVSAVSLIEAIGGQWSAAPCPTAQTRLAAKATC